MPSVEGVGSRRAALQMLDAVLRMGATLDSAARIKRGLSAADNSLAIAIAGETIRRLPELDALINSATKRPLPVDTKSRMVLRLALAQKLALNVPDHAIVSTALPLVDGGPRRLVHGVLGTLLRRNVKPLDATPLPEDVERRWERAWGASVVEAARKSIIKRPPLDLSFKDQSAADAFATFVGGVQLAPLHVRLTSDVPVDRLPGFASGEWWVQDLASSLPARLMPEAGTFLDACAAPGGKTMQLAARGVRVMSIDASETRLARLMENLERTNLQASIVLTDLLEWAGPHPFDAILLDAPCSATGTFRRHPEVLYRARGSRISEMADRQLHLLHAVSEWLRPGGTLVYSVCSLEREEGEEVIGDFLDGHPRFTIDPPKPGELPDFVTPSPNGWLRILPGLIEQQGGLDGFFVARLVRASD